MKTTVLLIAAALALAATSACGQSSAAPDAKSLRDSFAQQLAANKFVKDFARNGDDLTFTGPSAEASAAKWRVHIDSAAVEANTDKASKPEAQPYKGTIKSSWYVEGRLVTPSGRESNLPVELMANGLSNQECWAFWDQANKRWSWE